MATFFSMTRDINGYNGFGLQFPDNIVHATIVANTAASSIVPASQKKWLAIFSIEAGSNVFVSVNDTAAAPASASFVSTTSIFNPIGVQVNANDVISCLTTETSAVVTISFYALT